MMPLFWIVHDIDGERRVMIREAGAMIFARLEASMAKLGGKFIEAHQLDERTARKVPRKMIGRALTADEAATLLDRFG